MDGLLPLLITSVVIGSCFSAPVTTPSLTPTPVDQDGEAHLNFLDIEDVMMDPTAKMPWQKQVGDIAYLTDNFLLPEDPDDPFFELPVTAEQRSKRAAVRSRYKLWPNGVVPYKISDAEEYTERERRIIIKAMDHWENHTCIRFVPRTDQRGYVVFFPGGGCSSYVGRSGRNQGISLGLRCFKDGMRAALHEIGHALGFYHEHTRPDRDKHVRIITDNIIAGAESEFKKLKDSKVNNLGVGYDYNSIMHYDANLYSRNADIGTIEALDPSIPIGQATRLSALDIEETNRLYRCPAVPPPRSTIAPDDDEAESPLELPYPDCGAILTNLTGTIQSPGYPQYTHNIDCVWLIKLPLPRFNLILEFETFQIESSRDCESDYVQLYHGLDTSGQSSGKKCGRFVRELTSWSGHAYLHFHTSNSTETSNMKGFKLHYHVEDHDECNPAWKHRHCSHGCHNFPGGYECSCPEGYFMSSDGNHCFDVNECGLDKGGCDHKCINKGGSYHCACAEGYSLQSDNRTCVADGKGDPCIEANCEYKCELDDDQAQCLCPSGFQVDTDGRSCVDKNECLNSNGYCQHICNNNVGSYTCSCDPGYDLMPDGYSCLPSNPCPINNGGCEHICRFTGVSRECSCRSGYELASDGTSCVEDADLCASNGGRGDCEHTCTSISGSRVCSCSTGYQLLTDGVSCEDVNECEVNNGGCEQLHCINLEGSFECGCKEGFNLRGDGNGCAEILQGPSGKISSGNWPETYPINVDLQWVIQCESHQAVELTFSQGFGIAGSLPSCPRDWIKIYDGNSTSAELLGKFCHYAIPQVPKSSSNSLLVHFYAGPSHNPARKGFEISYTCVNIEFSKPPLVLPSQSPLCGQTLFTGSSGTIESPNWPQTYPTNLQCEYFIQLSDESSRIEISFDDKFGIAGAYPACSMDWVKIYDGHMTDDASLYGTYCHWRTPPVITTSGSRAKVVLFAGPRHSPSRRGFSANYRTI